MIWIDLIPSPFETEQVKAQCKPQPFAASHEVHWVCCHLLGKGETANQLVGQIDFCSQLVHPQNGFVVLAYLSCLAPSNLSNPLFLAEYKWRLITEAVTLAILYTCLWPLPLCCCAAADFHLSKVCQCGLQCWPMLGFWFGPTTIARIARSLAKRC